MTTNKNMTKKKKKEVEEREYDGMTPDLSLKEKKLKSRVIHGVYLRFVILYDFLGYCLRVTLLKLWWWWWC